MNFVIALQAEARPLIKSLKLTKRTGKTPFPVFESHYHRLVISGIGEIRSAAATGYLLGLFTTQPEAIINLGLAGHGSLKKGDIFIANRIFKKSEKAVHYPPQLINLPFPGSSLQTCQSPCEHYSKDIGYDMEAHAFCSVAYQSCTREIVQSIKVVSDNSSNPLSSFDPKTASNLIENQLDHIHMAIEGIEDLAKSLPTSPVMLKLIEKIKATHHFSTTQSHQLESCIRHACIFGFDQEKIDPILSGSSNSSEFIKRLKQAIEPLQIIS